MNAPANLYGPLFSHLEAARKAGDRAAYADLLTSVADLRIYEAAYLGIPDRYVDSASGVWQVPETVCRACWKTIDGPIFALGVDGSCLHFHPSCRPHYADREPAPLDELYEEGHPHPRRSCHSRLPHYVG